MSWLTDLAGKAEDFLVKIDQNAAQALTKEKVTPTSSRRESVASTASDVSSNVGQTFAFKSSPSISDLSKVGRSQKVDRDAELMASLNTDANLDVPTSNSVGNGRVLSNGDNNLSLQQENNLLKQEIKSLNQEIKQALENVKQARSENATIKNQLKSSATSLQTAEQKVRTLQSENVRLADQILDREAELSTVKSKLEAMHVEQQHTTKLEHLQKEFEEERKKWTAIENELKVKLNSSENQQMVLQSEIVQQQQQLQNLRDELSTTHQSFSEYKIRAQRILQDKDKLLQDIKQQQPCEGVQPSELILAELQQLQQERDLLREETAQVNAQLQQIRKETAATECRYEQELRTVRNAATLLESQLADEKNRREHGEIEVRQLHDELRYVREDLAQQRIQSATRAQQHEAELVRLRQQLAVKQNSISPGEVELERRLRALTETLVAKQSALEAMQSERSSLLLQLERTASLQDKESVSSTTTSDSGSVRVLLNITDDAKTATSVTRRVRHAYTTLDSLNFRLGQALRRRPTARLVLLIYMVVLHFWVAFVLLTYTPEVH